MPRTRTICIHLERAAIVAIVAGRSFRDIARQFGVGKDAVARHAAEHLPPLLLKAREDEEEAHALDIVRQLRGINVASVAILEEAREARDGDLALKAIDRIQRQIELQAKLLGELDERPVVNILASPDWLALRGRIVLSSALAPFPDARRALAEVLDADAG